MKSCLEEEKHELSFEKQDLAYEKGSEVEKEHVNQSKVICKGMEAEENVCLEK